MSFKIVFLLLSSLVHVWEIEGQLDPSSILKTIVSEDEIIDCVDIYKQPSLNHPLLKNHTLQLKRNPYPNELETKESVNSSEHTQMWHSKGEYCPEGTVAILRSSMTNLPPKKPSNRRTSNYANLNDLPRAENGEYATAFLAGDNFHGVNAIINIWNPIVEPNEYSSSQIWVTDGEGDKFESIEAGWMVSNYYLISLKYYPKNDGYHTSGCYNLECAGFVQTTARLSLGARIIGPVSTYGGDQRIITVKIKQDLKTGYWWLYYQGLEVGHWPGDRLFKHLPVAAALLEWGGEIINKEANGTHTGTQMGSGVFPSEGFRKAAYFRSLEYVDGGGQVNPAEGITGYATRSECYDVAVGKTGEGLGGVHFYYGGPGFSNNCYN
ncbi:hypothetical protein LINPERPRIM_LOCUS19255 [Linum perenne]